MFTTSLSKHLPHNTSNTKHYDIPRCPLIGYLLVHPSTIVDIQIILQVLCNPKFIYYTKENNFIFVFYLAGSKRCKLCPRRLKFVRICRKGNKGCLKCPKKYKCITPKKGMKWGYCCSKKGSYLMYIFYIALFVQ